jgi:hypothetical protein
LGGDPAYAVGGVPCTSIQPAETVGTLSPATFYKNPTSSFSDVHGSDGGSCGGGQTTSVSEPECEFNDEIGNDPLKGTWEETIAAWGPYVLDAECAEAWALLHTLVVLDSGGELTSGAETAAQVMATLEILNIALHDILPLHGGPIEEWNKVYLDEFETTTFVTEGGHHFELHFYRDVNGNTYDGKDFKIVFTDWFN